MRLLTAFVFCLTCTDAAAATNTGVVRELVHPFQPAGPVEVTGALISNRVMRTLQHYAAPAFTDLLAVHVAHTLQGASGVNVRVTRKPRRAGNEAAEHVAASPADGGTLLLADSADHTRAALRPVSLVAKMPYVLIAPAGGASVEAIVRDAKAGSSRVLIGSTSTKTAGRVALEVLRARLTPAIEPVVYNGGRDALQAVVTAQVRASLVPLPSALAYLGGNRLRPLMIADTVRHKSIPEVPTSAEAGLAGFDAVSWFGIFAPSATPVRAIQTIAASAASIAASADSRQVFSEFGVTLEYRAAGTVTMSCGGISALRIAARRLSEACPPA